MKRCIVKRIDAQICLITNHDGKISWSLGHSAKEPPLKKRPCSPPCLPSLPPPLPPPLSLPLPPSRPALSPSHMSPILLDETKSPHWKSPVLMAQDGTSPMEETSNRKSPITPPDLMVSSRRKSPSTRTRSHSLSPGQIKSSTIEQSPSPVVVTQTSPNVQELDPSPKGLFKVPYLIKPQSETTGPLKIEAIRPPIPLLLEESSPKKQDTIEPWCGSFYSSVHLGDYTQPDYTQIYLSQPQLMRKPGYEGLHRRLHKPSFPRPKLSENQTFYVQFK